MALDIESNVCPVRKFQKKDEQANVAAVIFQNSVWFLQVK